MIKPKAHVYVDGANIFYTQKNLGWNVDWKKMLELISKDFDVVETRYYTGIKNNDEKMKKYLHRLRNIGIKTITKPLKIIRSEQGGTLYKSNCDVEMAVDIILGVNHFDVFILFSGDSDFVYVVKILQKQFQKKIIVYSSRKTIAWEIKLACDDYIFLEDLAKKIKR